MWETHTQEVKDVGVRLRHARKLRGLNQVQLAKLAGLKQASISEIETGESKGPRGVNLITLARALKVHPEWLATGRGLMDANHEDPLPQDAIAVARDWLRLAPEVQKKVAEMIREMVKLSVADRPAVPDERVEKAYGRPKK